MRCLYDGVHPCGRCPACLANRQRGFMFRLDQEKDSSKFYFWLTLTYSDDFVPRLENGEMCFSKKHCRDFFEKIRKRYEKYGHKFKHFLVSEYGPEATHRPHYHCLLMIYNDLNAAENFIIRKEMRDFLIHKSWEFGNVKEKAFHGRVLRYLTKYCCKPELIGESHTMKPFTLISRGIGLSLLDHIPEAHKKQMIENLDFTYWYNGSKIQLSRYYVDKILPHSLQNLRDACDAQDWEKVGFLTRVRADLAKKQNLAYKSAHSEVMSLDPYDFKASVEYNKSLNDSRDYQWSIFRSKMKKRKNI